MRALRIGLAQINSIVGDLDGNFARILARLEEAKSLRVDLLLFPEMAVTGYPPEDLLLKPRFIQGALDRTRDLAEHTQGMTVMVGSIERDGDLYNAAHVMHDGKVVGTARKRYLPNYGVFDENRYFASERQSSVYVRGDVILGVNVCEDIWLPGGPAEEQVVRGGAEVILNLSASPYHHRKAADRRRMLSTRAADNLAIVAYVNLVGGQDEIVFDGGSFLIDQRGDVLAQGATFEEDLVVADVDLDEVFHARLHDTRLRRKNRRNSDEEEAKALPRVVLPPIAAPSAAPPALPRRPPIVEPDPVAEVYRALTLGLGDYVRKNGFKVTTVGLSGGIDSALTACIAVDALGPEGLVGVAMPSRYTSSDSQRDAEQLARNLGIRMLTMPIADVALAYERVLSPVFDGRTPDLTEENLQARIRGNYLMALSNKFGWLVLTTGNKSETSVGYSTLYGDTAGGFAALKDVYKTQVYALSRWRNTCGAPIPENTITRPPSAELRENQTDQDSLPPYDVLDPILELYVEEDRAVMEIVRTGQEEALVRRIVRLVDMAEFKRRQSPPGVKISPRAFGKDRRIPITNRWPG